MTRLNSCGSTHARYSIFLPANSRGVSIIEVLLVMAFIATLSATALPQTVSYLRQRTLLSEATGVRLFLEQLYGYSLSSRHPIKIALTPDSLTVTNRDILGENGGVPLVYLLHRGVKLIPTAGRFSTLNLYPSISASPTTLTLTLNGESIGVVISLRGRIRIR